MPTFPEFSFADSELARVIRGRRTVNDFKPAQPPLATILQAIELARWAPNHKLTEPWRFHLLGPQSAHEIVMLNTRLVEQEKGPEAARKKYERWSAIPGWIAVGCLRSDDPIRDEENYAAVCCAIQNVSLYLWSVGIGVKWSTGPVTRHPEFYELLGIDPNVQRSVGLLWYGYPAKLPQMSRQDVSEITRILP
jgi:nitroreductase